MALSQVSGMTGLQEEQPGVEELLDIADKYLQQGDYSKAVESYMRVVDIAREPINLSRAYFGLSLSYYFLQDLTVSEEWIRKVLEVDPEKEISVLFYPRSFVELFFKIKEEKEEKPRQEVKPKEEVIPEKVPVRKTGEPEVSIPRMRVEQAVKEIEIKKGRSWELDVHYSMWSIDLVMNMLEGPANDKIGDELSKTITSEITDKYPYLVKGNYEQNIDLDSGGSNYGIEIRYYPQGEKGSFSLGLSFEQTKVKLSLLGNVKQEFQDGSYGEAEASGFIEASLFSTNLSFRWDINPSWRVTPYFVLGFGVAPLKGKISYSYTGNYYWAGPQESIHESVDKTLKEFEEDIEVNIPNILFILQVNFGLKGEIFENFFLKMEAGFWDGFIIRGGLAYRF